MDIKKHELEWIIIFAFRYALGRSSTAASIIYEIDRANELDDMGYDCDRDLWLKLREELVYKD